MKLESTVGSNNIRNVPLAALNHDQASIFPGMGNIPYRPVLEWLHRTRKPDWYLEIGTASGSSLQYSQTSSIAVDPHFKIKHDITLGKPALHMLQMTSDDFFAQGIAAKLGARFDLAFLDGMHLFEYLLRDVIGTETLCAPDGMIVLHDCCPITFAAANRDWDTNITKAWTGDVWKIIPILRRYRPDLSIRVLDCPPSGLVLLTGLDPQNRVLADRYDEIVTEFSAIELDHISLPGLVASLQVESTGAFTGLKAPEQRPFARPPRKRSKSRLRRLEERFYKLWW